MAETLRIKDALERAMRPEQFIFGVDDLNCSLPLVVLYYAWAHADVEVLLMTWEEAEFAKIAINMTLAAQVENTNRLAAAAEKIGADWKRVSAALKCDRRIGPHSYLEPGRWQDSSHLYRDYVTLEGIIAR
jgi:UDPglucose 6-dehydrogenase